MITANHILKVRPWEFCAFCDANKSNYTITSLPKQDTTDERYIRACIDCFNNLVSNSGPDECAYCSNLAQYGTLSTQRYNKYGSRISIDIRNIPDERVLCENHFKEIRDRLEEERTQYTLNDFL